MKKGVLLMAYGSPEKPEDIEPFYTDIRRGNPPSPELLHELTERYMSIGGKSPLLEISQAQVRTVQEHLGEEYQVFLGMRHWIPWIHEAVADMKSAGITDAVGMVLAPHFSSMSVAKYIGKVNDALQSNSADISFSYIESWHTHPLFIEALAERTQKAAENLEGTSRTKYIFTAHSLPERILQAGDPYRDQLLETCGLIAEKLRITDWTFAFQSAGRTAEKWLGPDLLEVLEELGGQGYEAAVVCSIGFITDHLEVLYDIDFEGKQKAEELGMQLVRAESLNADPRLGALAAQLVKERL